MACREFQMYFCNTYIFFSLNCFFILHPVVDFFYFFYLFVQVLFLVWFFDFSSLCGQNKRYRAVVMAFTQTCGILCGCYDWTYNIMRKHEKSLWGLYRYIGEFENLLTINEPIFISSIWQIISRYTFLILNTDPVSVNRLCAYLLTWSTVYLIRQVKNGCGLVCMDKKKKLV